MERMKVVDRKTTIYNMLKDPQVKIIVLHGESGVGKTWIAREVSNVARRRGLFDIVLWVYLNREYDNDTLHNSIAQQLSLLPTRGVCEVEEDEEESKKEEVLKPEALPKKLQKKKILLVLDDEGNKMEELKIMGLLNNLFQLNVETDKVLITTRNHPTGNIRDERKLFKVEPFIRDESKSLLRERAFSDRQVEGIDSLTNEFLHRTEDIPNSIVMMAKAFKYFSDKKGGAKLLKRSLKEPSDSKIYDITDLLHSGYDLVPYSILMDCQKDANYKFFNESRPINCNELIAYWMMEGYLGSISCMETTYRKGHNILMELLDFQILKRIEADYVTVNLLGEEFDNFLLRNANDYYRHGYYADARLGMDIVFNTVEWKGLVKMSHKGGVMRTLPGGHGQEGKKASALLLDANSLAKDLPTKFIRSLKELQVLAIFNPTMDMLSLFSDDVIRLLHVFVLRSCQFMKNMDLVQRIDNFANLTILEISGPSESSERKDISCPSSLYKFPNDMFKRTPKLQSLNLSSLPITSVPPSLYELDELKWLILRDCTSLKTLNSLGKCKNLVVLDCSGSTSLISIKDKSFRNRDLKMINFSNTRIKNFPIIGTLRKLTHLLLSKCNALNRLPNIHDVVSLEVIDLSGACEFNELNDESMEKLDNIKILDLSGTNVYNLPASVGNPLHLCLENCTQIKGNKAPECLGKITNLERFVLSNAGIQTLHPMSHLTNLRQLSVTRCLNLEKMPDLSSLEKMEELDFSGCKSITSILDNNLDKMSRLQKLNLSGTSIEYLPSIANLSNLHFLLLKDCKDLKTLPVINSRSLEKLEELNLCGCKALTKIDAHFFDGTINLQILNLSEAELDELPSFSKLANLRELHLRNCKGLKSVPDLETLTNLEILDLSGSSVSDLPNLSTLSQLRQLMLKNCLALSLFREMGTLNALGSSVQNLPYGISGLTGLERLDLPSMDDFQGADSNHTNAMETKSDGCEWGISSLLAPKEKRPSLSVSGTQFLQPLEKDPILWESSLRKFHLAVYPMKELDAKSVHFQGDDFVHREIYLQTRHIGESNDQRLLEVYGFPGYKPEGIDALFSHANQLFFVDNKFQIRIPLSKEIIETLPSFLIACNSNQIKGCWIEKCREIKVIFNVKEIDKILGLLNSIETLWVSNASNLENICGKLSEDAEVFQKLEKLCVEYCPMLPSVFSLSRLPRRLKILKIKYCDKLESVFDRTSHETKLQYLETLHLWELPALKSIGCQLPALKTVRISNCPNLKKMEITIERAESLQNLLISNMHDLEKIRVSKELKYLSIESCPNLLEISTSSQLSSKLDVCVKFCKKLKSIFEEGTSPEIELEKLHLHGLPKLRSIGATLPNQANRFVNDCLNCEIDV